MTGIRWLIKKDGTKVLQELREVHTYLEGGGRHRALETYEWQEVETVYEEEV